MKNRYLHLTMTFVFLMLAFSVNAQEKSEKVTMSGYLKDGETGETLIGAIVYVEELATGATSNVYGFYSLSLPKGTYNVEFRYVGYQTIKKTIDLQSNQTVGVELKVGASILKEAVVVGEKENKNITNNEMSVNKVSIKTIEKLPALLGEVDVIRGIQLLPGVTTVGEGATGFNVRGGSIDQNLVLLDEAPVYNSSHLFGFFSTFNPDAVKDVKLYKGGIPARYGGRLSSILDVRMKEGNSKKLAVSGGVGVIFSRLSIEAPIIKDKASFIIAARRSYIDVLARPFLNDDLKDSKLNFYDLTLKTNYKINDNNKVFLSGYLGRDNFGFGDDAGFNWGNRTATLRWNHLFNDKLFSNLTTYFSDYDYTIRFGNDDEDRFDWDARILNYSLKSDVSWYASPKNLVTFGGQTILYIFEPGNANSVSQGESNNFGLPKKYALESGLFMENEQEISSKISLHYGLRFSHFNYMGEGSSFEFEDTEEGEQKELVSSQEFDQWESIQTYHNFEPRASIKYQLNTRTSLKLGYNRTAQYIHLISNTTAATPVDVWTPSTNNIEPQIADQIGLGLFRNFKSNMFVTSAEIYYKDFDHLVDYIDGANLFVNELIEADLLEADGRAYGLEVQLEKKKGRFTGWMSYTLARTERKVKGINNSEWFPSRFDQTHNFSTTLFYELSERWDISANFVLNSGTPATFPTSRIEQQGYVIPHNSQGSRGNVRIPVYHRLDLSATLKARKREGKRFSGEWVFSIYNAYNRRNAFSIFFRQTDDQEVAGAATQTEAVRLSVIGNFIPAVAYNFKF